VSDEDPVYADLHDQRMDADGTLDKIVEWSLSAVLGSEAGIVLVRAKNTMETFAPTSDLVQDAHDWQVQLREGPSFVALKEIDHPSVIIGDTATDPRFPTWGSKAAELGLRSVITSVLRTPDRRVGSLNVYGSEPHAFDLDDLEAVDVFARRAARAIVIAEEAQGREVALDTRKLIGQAQGMLMERFRIDGDRAFELLVRLSQQHNVKLRDVAGLLVRNPSTGLDELESMLPSAS
jgi:GAF domain-containing protein